MGGNKEKGISENGEIEKIVIGHCMKKKDKRGNFAPLFQHSRYYAYCLSRNIIAQDNVNNQSAPQSKTIKVEEGRSRKAYKNKARGIKKS